MSPGCASKRRPVEPPYSAHATRDRVFFSGATVQATVPAQPGR